MLTAAQNDRITRTGPNTALGKAVRRYWVPAMVAADLPEPGGDPVRVTLFNEDFVVFRAADGALGILDEHCRHRGASLMLGRVEDCGIRCIYHGWMFAPDGTVLETPNVADPKFRERFKANAYSIREAGGLAWVYLGPAESEPPLPEWPWFELPACNVIATRHYHHCNFVQVIEGLVDSSHLGILHGNALGVSLGNDLTYAQKVSAMQFDKAPSIEVQPTDFGFRYAAIRQIDGKPAARITAFAAPFTVVNPNGDVVTIVVPARDDLTMFFHVFWDESRPLGEEPMRGEHLRFIGLDTDSLEEIGALQRDDQRKAGLANGFYQDRGAMKGNASFSGLPGLIAEDVVVSVASGPTRDRTVEMLSVSDLAVAQLYRTLLAVADAGEALVEPPGATVDPRTSPTRGFDIHDLTEVDWREVA
ncbi:MAG TPA: Rieske 2Fe-2S domain-containing protein [Novosphingobium sp.]|nr:Rieske 2Fe-2S domain-containing protein [Novosphingobium sp.]